jgi:predicted O-methyltransferase YrrM
MSITHFLNCKGFHQFEGYSQQIANQVEDLIVLTAKPNIKMMEIGFNAGHSAEVFLQNNAQLHLTSFDLGQHIYMTTAKEFIDATYPNKHVLIIGDSRASVPEFIENYKDVKFDVIFIDGGHDYAIAKADMENCLRLAHEDTILILDDTIYTKEWEANWTIGPTKIWTECLQQNKIMEMGRKEYGPGRGMSWGKYIL